MRKSKVVAARRWLLGLCLAACVAAPAAAQGRQDAVRLLVGFPAGGAGDLIARLVADKMRVSLDRPVIVENRPGAGGRIAAQALQNEAKVADTVLISPLAPIVIAPLTFSSTSYDPATDFVPVAQLVKFPLSLAVGGDSPHRSLAEFSDWLRNHPGAGMFGTPAAGSQLHFLGLMYAQALGVEMTHVPYQGGTPLVTDLIGGQVLAGIDQFPLELYRAGKLRLLATSGAERSPLMPDVPTFAEQGFPSVQGEAWFGAFMNSRAPATDVERIGAALVQAIREPDVRDKLAQSGMEVTGLDAGPFAALVEQDRARWTPVIEASGFRGD
ncbi:MAG: tripartite tricarboxylate transporter substrate-binding protein [Pigmentiphaga sp.]|nr:tripartite tricarboxylate transporter substrate-binding protein [Pigmentiphaga sp.]